MGQINLTGSIGVPGSSSILGYSAVSMTDANLTLLPTQYSNQFLNVTSSVSLTATRNLVGPSNEGQVFIIENNTSGTQSIQIIASSGTGVLISPGKTVQVVFDGTNYLQITGLATPDFATIYNLMGG